MKDMIDMSDIEIRFSGSKFGEILIHHRKKLDLQTTSMAMMGMMQNFSSNKPENLTDWIDYITPLGLMRDFWNTDGAIVFKYICKEARGFLTEKKMAVTDDYIFYLFQIALLNFVYSTHKNKENLYFIQKSVGIGFIKRLFS